MRFPEIGARLICPLVFFRELGNGVVIPGQVTDNPEVVHPVARGRDLGMVLPIADEERVVLAHLVHVLAELRVAVALWTSEAVMMDLRVGMMVGRVARPSAGPKTRVEKGRRLATWKTANSLSVAAWIRTAASAAQCNALGF